MVEGILDKGAQPYRIWSQLDNYPGDTVGHLQIQRDEVEPVNVLPLVEMGVYHIGVTVEGLGEETLLLGRAQCALLEEIVFVHDTDFF